MDAAESATVAPQLQEVELAFTAARGAANPYTDTEAWADFTHEDGTKVRHPMFWDGGRTFRVRFASTKASGAEVGEGGLPHQAPAQFNRGSSGEPRVVVFATEVP